MRHSYSSALCAALALLLLPVTRMLPAAEAIPQLDLKPAWPNLKVSRPLSLESPPDGSGRLFLAEQAGRIRILPQERAATNALLFLDITARKPYVQDEEGLLGLAFHPRFQENGKFYLFYSQQGPMRSVVSEMQVSKSDRNKADPASERVLLEIPRPFWNHDGGALCFGPDGYLYISHGDGGQRDDPHDNAQNLGTLLGKILRIDVNSRTGALPYGIPKDNPFAGRDGARGEIWALGLRNVWRMSFDRQTGALWAGDVGQDKWEEINLITKGGNYGWKVREGFHPWKESAHKHAPYIDPILEYAHTPVLAAESKFPGHSPGVSITGGYVYRGKKFPALHGAYVYGDYRSGTLWGLRHDGKQVIASGQIVKPNPVRLVAGFGEDAAGELYVLLLGGQILEFAPAAKPAAD
jgi:quinoprotein glucose dehydrogenase